MAGPTHVTPWALLIEVFGLAVVIAAFACRPSAAPDLPPAARPARDAGLGAGDELEIRVADHETLSGTFQVGEDGTIRFPWIGVVEVDGHTPSELAETIEQRLADGYLREPQVTVRVVARQNREVSVLGQVKEPGSYAYKERLTLVQALSLAGGMTPLASKRKVKLIRDTESGRKTFEIDVSAILDSRREDLVLEPGDIVFVPESPI